MLKSAFRNCVFLEQLFASVECQLGLDHLGFACARRDFVELSVAAARSREEIDFGLYLEKQGSLLYEITFLDMEFDDLAGDVGG